MVFVFSSVHLDESEWPFSHRKLFIQTCVDDNSVQNTTITTNSYSVTPYSYGSFRLLEVLEFTVSLANWIRRENHLFDFDIRREISSFSLFQWIHSTRNQRQMAMTMKCFVGIYFPNHSHSIKWKFMNRKCGERSTGGLEKSRVAHRNSTFTVTRLVY